MNNRYDEAQLRFKSSAKVSDSEYVRQDGTLTYYFTLDNMHSLSSSYIERDPYTAVEYSMIVVEIEYIFRQVPH